MEENKNSQKNWQRLGRIAIGVAICLFVLLIGIAIGLGISRHRGYSNLRYLEKSRGGQQFMMQRGRRPAGGQFNIPAASINVPVQNAATTSLPQ